MKNEGISILVVEDHKLTRDGMALLMSEHYRCTVAESAEEAVRMLSVLAFNLVITDIKMPGASGIDLCTYIHQVYPDTVVIAVSGLASIHDQAAAMRQGALYYIEKPLDAEKLIALVESALRCQELAGARRYEVQTTAIQ